ncbi:MAG TPA: amino acid adenylation domain-containing protein [Actinophytocola sp.]|nr:amino acid adenylation domain-containing protein [Actinophytocola sp.]
MTIAPQRPAGLFGPPSPYPAASLAELVLAQARRTPDAVAVRQWDRTLTYRELAGRAGALAAELRAAGVRRGDRVGLWHGRTPELVVAVLGVLFTGAAYVPLDRAHPHARLVDIAADAGLRVVVVDIAEHPFAGLTARLVPADAADLDTLHPGPAGPDDIAHVLYTSGSTGRPKGVLTTHRNVVAFATAMAAHTGAHAGTRAFGYSSPAFDAFTFDVYLPLLVGAATQLVGDADRMDPARLERFIVEHRVDWGVITPPVLRTLDPARVPGWRSVICGGDLVPPEEVERWTGPVDPPRRRFWNIYGPTETTVVVTGVELSGRWSEPLPIGLPLPNHRAHVVDEDLRPLPPGKPGELLIGGAGVSPGYLDRPALTAERFVPDPFSGDPGARLYRTGDIVRQRPDGRLDFLGRRDGQLKINGQRIELAEVEAVLRELPGVDEAEVVAVREGGEPVLVAFVAGPAVPSPAQVRDGCARRLTAVMVPRRIHTLDALPVQPSTGKVDRVRLRELASEPEPGAETVGLAGIWQRVLGGAPAPESDFFAAGGHSIAVMRLVAAVRAELGKDVGADDVFTGRTFAGIAARVDAAGPVTAIAPATGNPPTLSPSQRRLWFLDQLAPDSSAYNIAFAERLRGPLDVDALRAALRTVAQRHEVLRWRIVGSRGVPVAVCDPPADVPLPVLDVTEAELAAGLAATAATPFDLATGPVWRATLYRLAPTEHVLGLVLHHAVADGWSQSVLYRDLAAAYTGTPLPPLPAGYADYAVWRADRDGRDGDADLAWWVDHLAGAPTTLDLPRDRPRPAVQTYTGELASAAFPAGLDAEVRRHAAEQGATPSLVLLAAFGQVLARLTGRADNVVGVVLADRAQAAFEDLVGFCVDIVPVRLRAGDRAGFTNAVRACRQEFLDVTAHPAAPLERIVGGLDVPRDPSRSALVQVLFNVFNFAEPRLAMPDLRTEPVPVAMPGSPFDLTVYLVERDGAFALDVVFNPDLFDRARIDALLAGYLRLLGELVAEPERPAAEVAADCPDPAARRFAPGAAPAHVVPVRVSGPLLAGPAAQLRTPTEHAVAAIWRELLKLDAVGPTDNFFDVGGHSLMIVTIQARLAELLGRTVSVVDLFQFPNIRALAAHLDGAAVADVQLARASQRASARRDRARRRTAARTAEGESET